MPKPFPLVVLLALATLVTSPLAAAPPTDVEVSEAIVRMQNWLLKMQDPTTGGWDKPPKAEAGAEAAASHKEARKNGESLMATYALLVSGWSPQEERLDKAIRFLRENDPWGTYGTSVRAHIWAFLPDSYLPNLQKDADWLIKAQTGGLWNYGPVRGNRVDHSTSQYGVLGLWEYTKRGGRTPPKIWQDAVVHFLEYQGKDGGWAYSARGDVPGEARGSMTAAGLTVLYIAIQQLYAESEVPVPVRESLVKGHAWLDKHFTADHNPQPGAAENKGPQPWYYLYGIERVALASGAKTFAGKDWFEAGAARILAAEREQGHVGGVVDTSFCLMFLSRGRVPVWINKLQLVQGVPSTRPNDLYNFTGYLSNLRESELNWQVVGIDTPSSGWMNTPVAWLSSDDEVELSDAQQKNLKAYLDLGGMLIANPEGGRDFAESVRALGTKMYPDLQFKPLPTDHPMLNMFTNAGAGAARGTLTLNNGVRDLITLFGDDWGKDLQANRSPGDGEAWKVMTNVYGIVTERGRLDNRLVQRIEPRVQRPSKGEVTVARASYQGGAWGVEPQAWEPFRNVFFNLTGLELKQSEVALDKAGESTAALLHLAGVEVVELSDAEKLALKRYVEKGGTVFVETIGGRGDFSLKIEEQLRPVFEADALPLASFDPIVTGQGLEGGQRVKVLFRQYSVLNMAAKRDARLSTMAVNGRPAVVISHDDLSLGAMGMKRWGINGYQAEPARDLLTNILLTAAKHRKK